MTFLCALFQTGKQMKRLNVVNWLRDVSISRKLYFTVGIMATLIIIELVTLSFAIKTLSSVRALVGAEGLWSKAQKDAAYSLGKYGRSHDEADYLEFKKFLRVPLGDHVTRMELLKAKPDMEVARQGFLEGRFHAGDIDGAINVLTRFHNISYIQKAVAAWSAADTLMLEFVALGDELHREITSSTSSPDRVNELLRRMDPMNDRFTVAEDEFSFTLGDGSRWLEQLILKLLLGLVLTVEISGLTLTIVVSRSISRGLNEILDTSARIASGDLTARARAFSGDEIGRLAVSFNDMTATLQEYIDALKKSEEDLKVSTKLAEQSAVVKENFLANMSHEIRTPMNAVIGFTDILEHSNLDEEQKQVVEYLKISGKNLLAIINDILDYSKIESGMIAIEQTPFSIHTVFESLRVMLQQKVEGKHLHLELRADKDIPANVIGDPTRLMQILLNLADNAVKFTEQGSVGIYADVVSNTRDSVTISFQVKDSGEGIPEDKFSVIFERFTQARADTTRKHGGTGLGLSIVKSLVALQNGQLSLKSEKDIGSIFSFTLTYKKVPQDITDAPGEQPVPAPVPQPLSADTEGKKLPLVLYAEDNLLNQVLVTKAMKPYGITVEMADNGQIAVDKLRNKHYDIVLMDIAMPKMDGHEATRLIRTELKSNVPIIALTAHAMNEERERCFQSGMNDFVSKPFDARDLYARIMALYKPA